MNCPACNIPMLPVMTLECRTGNAKQHKCPRCLAKHWEQLEEPPVQPRLLKQVFNRRTFGQACIT